MNSRIKARADLTVLSFIYIADQLAKSQELSSRSALYEMVRAEAEKHKSALRLVQRDAFEAIDQGLRSNDLPKAAHRRKRKAAAQTIEKAMDVITRTIARHEPHKMVA